MMDGTDLAKLERCFRSNATTRIQLLKTDLTKEESMRQRLMAEISFMIADVIKDFSK